MNRLDIELKDEIYLTFNDNLDLKVIKTEKGYAVAILENNCCDIYSYFCNDLTAYKGE